MFQSIFVSVLALVAVACAALAWITSLRLKLETESKLSTHASSLTRLAAQLVTLNASVGNLKSTSAPKLAAEVAELSDAVARLAKTQQRFAGKYYAEGSAANASARNAGDVGVGVLDDELAAELALQKAPPVRPGG